MTILKEAVVCTIAATIMLTIAAHTNDPEFFQIVPLLAPSKAIIAKRFFWPN
jgi:hypothetical protein